MDIITNPASVDYKPGEERDATLNAKGALRVTQVDPSGNEAATITTGDPVTAQIAVGTTATLLFAANTTDIFREIANPTANVLYIGGAGVATTTGHAIPAGARFTLDARLTRGNVYGVFATAGTVTTLRF